MIKTSLNRVSRYLKAAWILTTALVTILSFYAGLVVYEKWQYKQTLNSIPAILDYGHALTRESARGYVASQVPQLQEASAYKKLHTATQKASVNVFSSRLFDLAPADKDYLQKLALDMAATRQLLHQCDQATQCDALGQDFLRQGTNLHAHLSGALSNLFFQTPIYDAVVTDHFNLMRIYLNFRQALSAAMSTVRVMDVTGFLSQTQKLRTRFNAVSLQSNKLDYILSTHRDSFSKALIKQIQLDQDRLLHLENRYIFPMLKGTYHSSAMLTFGTDTAQPLAEQVDTTLRKINDDLHQTYQQQFTQKTLKHLFLVGSAWGLLVVLTLLGRGIRRQAIIPLQENEAILNTAAAGIVQIDHHGMITRVNPSALRLFGYDQAALIGHNVKKLMPEAF